MPVLLAIFLFIFQTQNACIFSANDLNKKKENNLLLELQKLNLENRICKIIFFYTAHK